MLIYGMSLPFLVAKCFYQLSQMKTNGSIIPLPISKPIRTFLDWVTTFHSARFVHTKYKHHLSSYIFTLHKDNSFCHADCFSQTTLLTFLPLFCKTFQHRLTSDFLLFFAHLPPLHYKSKLRMIVPKYNCDFHF